MLIHLDDVKDNGLDHICTLVMLEHTNGNKPLFIDNLLLSAIGARICYSEKDPISLLSTDPRIYDLEERVKFLKRLAKAKHYSVFAHTPIFTEYLYVSSEMLPYKCWWHDVEEGKHTRRYACLNARHLLEYYSDIQEELIDSVFEFHYNEEPEKYVYVNGTIFNWEDIPGACSSPYILALVYDKEPWQWYSIIVHGLSVIFTHQVIRHTWLNVSQRSHRYTKVDDGDVYIPPTIKDSLSQLSFDTMVSKSFDAYGDLIRWGIPKEDARYILPSGRKTTIMLSGPRFVWEDFINKRNISKAQHEIRWLAKGVQDIINMVGAKQGG